MKRFLNGRTIIAIALALAMIMCIPTVKTHASSAGIEFTGEPAEVRVGDVVTVTMTVNADVTPGDIEGYISYTDSVLEYVTGPECVAGGEGILKINDPDPDTGMSVRKYSMYFKAVKLGTFEIRMRGTPEIYEAESGYLMSVSSDSLTIEVQPAAKASSDASLATLKVNPGKLSPAFSPSVLEYNTEVSNDVTSLLVSAGANDATATVKIEGNSDLSVGSNRVLVLVTAEDGTIQRYVIYVTRAEAGEIPGTEDHSGETDTEDNTPKDDTKPENKPGSTYFYVTEEDGEVILNAGSRYSICEDVSTVAVPDGYFKTSVLISGHTVVAYSPKEDVSSDFLLLVLSHEGGEPELYSFDRIEKTLQRYSVKKGEAIGNKTTSGYATLDEQELVAGYEKSLSNLTMIIAVLCGVVMLLLILTIRMVIRARNAERRRAESSRRRSTEDKNYRARKERNGK